MRNKLGLYDRITFLQELAKIRQDFDRECDRGKIKALCERWKVPQATMYHWVEWYKDDIRLFDDRASRNAEALYELGEELRVLKQQHQQLQDTRFKVNKGTRAKLTSLSVLEAEVSTLRETVRVRDTRIKELVQRLHAKNRVALFWKREAAKAGRVDMRGRTGDRKRCATGEFRKSPSPVQSDI